MRMRLRSTAAALLSLLAAGAAADEFVDGPIPFHPAPGDTLAYKATETANQKFRGKDYGTVTWSERIVLKIGKDVAGDFEGTVTVSAIAPELTGSQPLRYMLARAIEGTAIAVIVDKGGFVQRVLAWPEVRAAAVARLPSVVSDRAIVPFLSQVLLQLDEERAAVFLSRSFRLLAATHMMQLRENGVPVSVPDWRGWSAHEFPGRSLLARLTLDEGRNEIRVAWDLTAERSATEQYLKPQLTGVLRALAGQVPSTRGSKAEIAEALASEVELSESAVAYFDRTSHIASAFEHKLTIKMGPYEKYETVTLERIKE